ncbi:MAG: DUF559 domain-containing protein [Sphingomonas sp.]|nr:DUF559 domain-containing protein [Sphingomonas sp.]
MADTPKVLDRNAVLLRARALRRAPSLPEGLLWGELRKRPAGLKFRRQHPLRRYVVDFYCASARLVVEVDGESHRMGRRPEQDEARDRWLREQGLKVLRFGAVDVIGDLEAVVTAIAVAARE